MSVRICLARMTKQPSPSSTACVAAGGERGVLCADGHKGYAQPIGGVVAYRDPISISGVGFDIACGNLAHPHGCEGLRCPARRLA